MDKNKAADTFKCSDLKNTKQRTAIQTILENSSQPVSAEEIYAKLIEQKISVSLSTIYRTLEVMVSKELAIKLIINDESKALYELNRKIHKHYLVCLDCKKILSVMCCPLEEYEERLAVDTGFLIEGHKLNIYGYCPECRKSH